MMKNLFSLFNDYQSQLREQPLVIFLDYDGTLTAIADKPANAVLLPQVRQLLQELAEAAAVKVCIVSGRALSDIKSMVGLDGISYIGNHGLEADIAGGNAQGFDFKRTEEVLYFLKTALEKALSPIAGIFIEDKGIVLSVHYRLVVEGKQQVVLQMIHKIIEPFVLKGEIRIGQGKKVVEIKPPFDWDKGKAVLLFEDQVNGAQKPTVIYAGDDMTDEDAFKALKGKAITIKVGEGESLADYQVNSHNEVIIFLKEILNVRGKKIHDGRSEF